MQPEHKPFIAAIGVTGSIVNHVAEHAHSIMGTVAFWAGGIAAVLSVICFSWDIYNKWKHRKD